MYPEEGRSAIAAAARGDRRPAARPHRRGDDGERRDDQGGTAGNIVPSGARFVAEARSHDERKLGDVVQEMVDAFAFAARARGLRGRDQGLEELQGLPLQARRRVVRIAHAALEHSGYTPSYGLSGGAADANVFNERGLACLNLANGMQDIHTPDERITVDDLEGNGRGDARARRRGADADA
jgi:tripeptide aminopeptidase